MHCPVLTAVSTAQFVHCMHHGNSRHFRGQEDCIDELRDSFVQPSGRNL